MLQLGTSLLLCSSCCKLVRAGQDHFCTACCACGVRSQGTCRPSTASALLMHCRSGCCLLVCLSARSPGCLLLALQMLLVVSLTLVLTLHTPPPITALHEIIRCSAHLRRPPFPPRSQPYTGASPDVAAPGGVRPLHIACAGQLTSSSMRSKVSCLIGAVVLVSLGTL